MAPSITTPHTHVRGGGMSVTQLKSHCRGGIRRTVSGFHSRAPLLPSFQPSLASRRPPLYFFSLPRSPLNFSCALTIEMSSLSPLEQRIRAEVDWCNTAVRSPLRPVKMFHFQTDGLRSNNSLSVSFALDFLIESD